MNKYFCTIRSDEDDLCKRNFLIPSNQSEKFDNQRPLLILITQKEECFEFSLFNIFIHTINRKQDDKIIMRLSVRFKIKTMRYLSFTTASIISATFNTFFFSFEAIFIP